MKERLEEAAKNESEYLADYDDKEMYQNGFIAGALWQQEQDKKMYSEEDLKYAYEQGKLYSNICYCREFDNVIEIIKTNKL
jgi:hypothetical protein